MKSLTKSIFEIGEFSPSDLCGIHVCLIKVFLTAITGNVRGYGMEALAICISVWTRANWPGLDAAFLPVQMCQFPTQSE